MGKTILIVDDSESIREVVSFTLEGAGHSVLKGVDGQDALKLLDGKDIDLIITDLHMPIMDGISLIREVRQKEQYKFVPILFLTTESQTEKKMEAKEAGATGWIVKPFVPEKLLAAINKVVR
ncbi:MAG: two-component system response regulator [Bacteroidetes bacterium GWE2_29_8]|nr:MAG: two-component system response regulator [Bacteroidetes bacterium GWE2_29_8]OFY20082.1 MAG: two-component system response regulator [Bacteroidetes bacterium GWF2_29_10]